MLKSLEIKDYALIEHIQITFHKGLNIITGETGAGKSILIDAMSLLLGERASSEVIRKGSEKSFVEGIFNVEENKKIKSFLTKNEIEHQPELIIRREISLKGSNRCFVNDSPVPLNVVKEIGDLLVDLHGQHEHQSLLKTDTHIDFLDEFAGNSSLLSDFRILYDRLNKKRIQLNDLLQREETLNEKKEIYSFQIKEIDSVNPTENEDEELSSEINILENSEKLLELSDEIYRMIYDGDDSVNDKLGETKHKLDQLARIDMTFQESLNECDSALAIIKELASTIRNYRSRIDINTEELEVKRERLAALNMLKKKFGGSLSKVMEHRKKIGQEVELAENFASEIKKLESEINQLRIEAGNSAEKLSSARKKASSKTESEVKKVLSLVGIPDSSFVVKISNLKSDSNNNFIIVKGNKFRFTEKGIDEVEFFISTNPGEDPKPLVKVASGGEVSRIMLSLKTILAKSDKLPLLIFDEIDTGVSGRIAQKVGNALKDLAKYHQIIAITHLPQIAGLADHHFVVEKKTQKDRVISIIKEIDSDQRITEIAKLLSGETVTGESLKTAKQLIGSINK